MLLTACEDIRARLDAFHDDELDVHEQLLVRDHLETCASCTAEHHELVRVRLAFMAAAPERGVATPPPESWTAAVLEQTRVERQMSWHTWLMGVFDDMHLVWPAIGATAAVLVCLLASAQVMHATTEQRPDSLAGVIDYLASPGSNVNPARMDSAMMIPRRHETSTWPTVMTDEDAVLALSAVVTREGRIRNVEMLAAEQARALKVKPDVVLAMLDAASRAQFEPARAGGAPIAVSMVWVLAHTTVVGREADVERLLRPLGPEQRPVMGPVARTARQPKPIASTTPAGGANAFAD